MYVSTIWIRNGQFLHYIYMYIAVITYEKSDFVILKYIFEIK